jgi:hypothetical protein
LHGFDAPALRLAAAVLLVEAMRAKEAAGLA